MTNTEIKVQIFKLAFVKEFISIENQLNHLREESIKRITPMLEKDNIFDMEEMARFCIYNYLKLVVEEKYDTEKAVIDAKLLANGR